MSGSVTDAQTTDITVVAPRPAASAATPAHGLSFRSILSALNPLQLIPVVGTIYRAVTGDEGDPDVRFFGSLAVSGLTGGPIGLGINLLEKITGIDPEAIAFRLLGIHPHHVPAARDAAPPASSPASAPDPASTRTTAWTAEQMRAYGVQTLADGTLAQGSARGADVLNGLELGRLHRTA